MARPEDLVEPLTRILVEKLPDPQQIGSILLPESVADHGTIAVVLKTPPGTHPDFAPGRRLIYKPFTGTGIDLDGVPCLLLDPTDVICLLADEDAP
jgi:hypothetical protein